MNDHPSPAVDAAIADELNNDISVILTSDRRQRLLMKLSERRAPRDLESLAAEIASAEAEDPNATEENADAETIAVLLHHLHLPKLDDYGLIDYDAERHTVGLTTGGAGWATVLSQCWERTRKASPSA